VDAISQIKPAQHLDEGTPAFWALILADIRYVDARQAVINLGGKAKFIDPSDIIAEVRRIRNDRLERTEIPAPNVHPDHVADYLTEQTAIRASIADGDFDADVYRGSGLTLTGVPARLAITAAGEPLVERPDLSRELVGMFHRPEKPLPVHYGPRPLAPVKDIPPEEIARREAERDRQIAALAETYGATSVPSRGDG
jgi:hypothetical protein